MLTRRAVIILLIVLLGLFCMHADAFASDTALTGFNLHTFHPASDGSGVLSLTGTQTLGHLKPAFGVFVQGAGGLAEAANPVNRRRSRIVDAWVFADMTGAIGLTDFLDFGLIVPVQFYETGMSVNTQRSFQTAGVGDLLIDVKGRLLQDGEGRIGIGLLGRLSVPTGQTRDFSGWNDPTGEFRLLIDKGFSHGSVVANVGYRIAARTTVRNTVGGVSWGISDDDRLVFGLGGDVRLPFQNRSWKIVASVYGESVVDSFQELMTPIEIDAGIAKEFKNGISLQLGGGRGLTDALGSPAYRAFAAISFDGGRRWRNQQNRARVRKNVEWIREVILFGFDDDGMSPAGRKKVDGIAQVMEGDERLHARVEGYTDAVGDEKYNDQLGLRRARAVSQMLHQKGVQDDRVQVESFGERQPIESNRTRDGRRQNRRVTIDLIPAP